jgi:two-component system chemotaxis response regulator CheB
MAVPPTPLTVPLPTRPIRLMLVDDSVVAQSVFQRMLSPWPAFEVVATASTAPQALDRLAGIAVDIILLDVEMPGMDGLTALPLLIEKSGGARVLIVSSACDTGSDRAVRALTLGAADTLTKPGAGSFGGRFAEILAEKLLRIGHMPGRAAGAARAAPVPVQPPVTLRPPVPGPIGCIAIGASTGGLHALSAFFKALPAEVAVPILITQHLPAAFMPYFAAQLRDIAGRAAKVAVDGDRLGSHTMLIAPGDAHLGIVKTATGHRVKLDATPVSSGCLPSVDPMLDAVAGAFGPTAVGVVLSGMGRDGAVAARGFGAAGGEILVQDMASSVIWGMPGAVATAGEASGVLPPDEIARRIARRWAAATATAVTTPREPVAWR